MKSFRRRRFVRRSTFRRRPFRKFSKPGTKRFYRRQRRNAKPEIKFFYNTQSTATGTVVPGRGRSIDIVSPTAIPSGTEASERVGRQIKYRKIIHTAQYFAFADATVSTNNVDQRFRVIFWYPTRDYNSASTYMISLPFLEAPDWNTVKVVSDKYYEVSFARYVFTAVNENFNPSPPTQTNIVKKTVFPFPRTVEFIDQIGTVDPNKDRLYCTLINPGTMAINWQWSSKTTFIDP